MGARSELQPSAASRVACCGTTCAFVQLTDWRAPRCKHCQPELSWVSTALPLDLASTATLHHQHHTHPTSSSTLPSPWTATRRKVVATDRGGRPLCVFKLYGVFIYIFKLHLLPFDALPTSTFLFMDSNLVFSPSHTPGIYPLTVPKSGFERRRSPTSGTICLVGVYF